MAFDIPLTPFEGGIGSEVCAMPISASRIPRVARFRRTGQTILSLIVCCWQRASANGHCIVARGLVSLASAGCSLHPVSTGVGRAYMFL